MRNYNTIIYVHKYSATTGKVVKVRAEVKDGAAWADWGESYPVLFLMKDYSLDEETAKRCASQRLKRAKEAASKKLLKLTMMLSEPIEIENKSA